MAMRFMSPTNPTSKRIELLNAAKGIDPASITQIAPMPAELKAALDAKRPTTTAQLPAALVARGAY